MLIYHASTIEILHPDTLHSRDNLDFGKGFYATILYEQARKYSERFILRNCPAFINKYEFTFPAHPKKYKPMQANRTILNMKYARIISEIAKMTGKDSFEAMDIFYNSLLFPLIDNGIADLHCRSDKYLAREIVEEYLCHFTRHPR